MGIHGLSRIPDREPKKPSKWDKPIKKKWLRKVGFQAVESNMGPDYHPDYANGDMAIWEFNGTGVWHPVQCDHIELKTRRDVRRLARLMRVVL